MWFATNHVQTGCLVMIVTIHLIDNNYLTDIFTPVVRSILNFKYLKEFLEVESLRYDDFLVSLIIDWILYIRPHKLVFFKKEINKKSFF